MKSVSEAVISKMETTSSFTSPLEVVYKTKFLLDCNSFSIMVFDLLSGLKDASQKQNQGHLVNDSAQPRGRAG